MQKIVLFIEPNNDAWRTPFKIAELVINRFYFEEEASFKIVKIFELGKLKRLNFNIFEYSCLNTCDHKS